jgi:glycogen phosphorylase
MRKSGSGLASGQFSRGDKQIFRPLVDQLLNHDPYLLFADYQSYIDCQDRVGETWHDYEKWSRMAILNVAHMGKFSSDRAIREYSSNIWRVDGIAHS